MKLRSLFSTLGMYCTIALTIPVFILTHLEALFVSRNGGKIQLGGDDVYLTFGFDSIGSIANTLNKGTESALLEFFCLVPKIMEPNVPHRSILGFIMGAWGVYYLFDEKGDRLGFSFGVRNSVETLYARRAF